VFPLEQWLRERATVTRYTHIAHLVPSVVWTGCRAKCFTEVNGIDGRKTGVGLGGRSYAPALLPTVQNGGWAAGPVWMDLEKRLSPTPSRVPTPDRPSRSESLHWRKSGGTQHLHYKYLRQFLPHELELEVYSGVSTAIPNCRPNVVCKNDSEGWWQLTQLQWVFSFLFVCSFVRSFVHPSVGSFVLHF
jgi:hypothetical protein